MADIPEFVVPEKRPVGRPRKPPPPKRPRGRPRKDEVVEPKRIVVHANKNINPKNRLKYAEDTVRNAERIYEMYSRPYPNPLNIEEKNLLKEARAAWEYVYSLRDPAVYKKANGDVKLRMKAILNGEELLFLFEAFCDYIRDQNFTRSFTTPDGEIKLMPIVPNQATFAKWLGMRRNDIHDVISKEKPEVAEQYKSTLADLLSEGAMVGAYAASSTIFSLKNLCDWADKYEDRSKPTQKTTVEEAAALMEQLGYTKPKLLGDNNG